MLTARADVEQLGDDAAFEGHLWSDVEAVEDLFSPANSHSDLLVRPQRGGGDGD